MKWYSPSLVFLRGNEMSKKEELFDLVNELNLEIDILGVVIKGGLYVLTNRQNSLENNSIDNALSEQFERAKRSYKKLLDKVD